VLIARRKVYGAANGSTRDVLVLAAGLAVYGNGVSLALAEVSPAEGWAGVGLGVVPAAAMFVWARRMAALSMRDLGLSRRGVVRSAWIGLLVALAVAVPAVLFLNAPVLVGRPVTYAPLSSLSTESLLWRALVWMPLDTAFPEEVGFRGVLLAALLRRFAAPGAVVISAVAFTLWHAVIVSRTLGVTNLAGEPLLLALGLAGAFGSVLIGGVLFAVVRLATGHLVGSIVAHWAFNAVLLLGLYRSNA
jgi:membrane protease YdiL (CAAX protease family)